MACAKKAIILEVVNGKPPQKNTIKNATGDFFTASQAEH